MRVIIMCLHDLRRGRQVSVCASENSVVHQRLISQILLRRFREHELPSG